MIMQKTITKYLFIAATVITVISLLVLARHEFNDPERVFNAMLQSNLSSQGVTRSVEQESAGQTLFQTIQAQLGEENVVAGRTVLVQGSGDSATSIVTESIGTPETDYIRYVDIETSQTGASGQPLNFNEIIDVWGRSSAEGGALTGGELFSEAVLGVVPMGNLPAWQREAFVNRVNELDVYEIDYSQVERRKESGRPVYIYNATVKPERYVTMLKEFGDLIGVGSLEATDPALFRDSPELSLQLEVDVWSRQLRAVAFNGSERSETYSAYGLNREVSLPEETITIQELQSRLQNVQ